MSETPLTSTEETWANAKEHARKYGRVLLSDPMQAKPKPMLYGVEQIVAALLTAQALLAEPLEDGSKGVEITIRQLLELASDVYGTLEWVESNMVIPGWPGYRDNEGVEEEQLCTMRVVWAPTTPKPKES